MNDITLHWEDWKKAANRVIPLLVLSKKKFSSRKSDFKLVLEKIKEGFEIRYAVLRSPSYRTKLIQLADGRR